MTEQPKRHLVRRQRMTVINGIFAFVVLTVILQLWLFTATVNAVLGGDYSVVWPAALVSLVCLGLNLGLLRYLYRTE